MEEFKALKYWKIQLSELEEELKKIKTVEELKEFIDSVDILIGKLTKKLAYINTSPIPDRFEAHLVSVNLSTIYLDMVNFLESWADYLNHKGTESEDFWRKEFEKERQKAKEFLPFSPELILELPESYKRKIFEQFKILEDLEKALYDETQKVDLASYFKKLYADLGYFDDQNNNKIPN